MAVERVPRGTLIDVLDRVLDKGIFIWGVGIAADPSTPVAVPVHPCMQVSLERAEVRQAFAGGASSGSALPRSDDDDGSGNTGSSGAPALVYVQIEPRRPHPTRPRRTRDR